MGALLTIFRPRLWENVVSRIVELNSEGPLYDLGGMVAVVALDCLSRGTAMRVLLADDLAGRLTTLSLAPQSSSASRFTAGALFVRGHGRRHRRGVFKPILHSGFDTVRTPARWRLLAALQAEAAWGLMHGIEKRDLPLPNTTVTKRARNSTVARRPVAGFRNGRPPQSGCQAVWRSRGPVRCSNGGSPPLIETTSVLE